VALFHALPWRVGATASDGWWVLEALRRSGPLGQDPAARRRLLEGLRDVELRVGSAVGAWYARVVLAWIDLAVGREPDGVLEEEAPQVDPDLLALKGYVAAEWHCRQHRPLAALREIRGLRGAPVSGMAADLLALAEARTWLALDEARPARLALERVSPAGVAFPDALAVRVAVALGYESLPELSRAAATLAERLDGPFLDAPGAVCLLWDAARAMADAGDVHQGEDLARRARVAAARLVAAAAPGERPALLVRLGEPAGLRVPAGAA
jgi:hypothetical protein